MGKKFKNQTADCYTTQGLYYDYTKRSAGLPVVCCLQSKMLVLTFQAFNIFDFDCLQDNSPSMPNKSDELSL